MHAGLCDATGSGIAASRQDGGILPPAACTHHIRVVPSRSLGAAAHNRWFTCLKPAVESCDLEMSGNWSSAIQGAFLSNRTSGEMAAKAVRAAPASRKASQARQAQGGRCAWPDAASRGRWRASGSGSTLTMARRPLPAQHPHSFSPPVVLLTNTWI